jgi:hypothetical protein
LTHAFVPPIKTAALEWRRIHCSLRRFLRRYLRRFLRRFLCRFDAHQKP